MLYILILVVLKVFLLFCYFYVNFFVLKALIFSLSIIVFCLLCLQASFCLHARGGMESFLYCRILSIYMYTSTKLITPCIS